jgi:hypothetical protein
VDLDLYLFERLRNFTLRSRAFNDKRNLNVVLQNESSLQDTTQQPPQLFFVCAVFRAHRILDCLERPSIVVHGKGQRNLEMVGLGRQE